MKTKIILLSLMFLTITCASMNAQMCNTPSPEPPSWLFNSALQSTQSMSTTYTLCVFVHIVRSSSGNGLGSGIVSAMISKLNSDYTNTGIQFQSIGNDFINSDVFYSSLVTSEYAALYATNSHTNAIDIYVLGTSTNTGNTLGAAASIPATALWIHGNYYNTSVLSHEMGHCLGLYHTHHGTVTEYGGDPLQCKELVNGSNSSTCGDYVTDTPADPNIWNGCNYIGTVKDDNNQSYNPNPSNYMSYSSYTCWSLFTSVQRQRMKDFIANTTILQNVIYSPPPTISGPSSLCVTSSTPPPPPSPGRPPRPPRPPERPESPESQTNTTESSNSTGTYTVTNPPANFTWSCSSNLTKTSQSGNTATFSASSNGAGWVSIKVGSTELVRKSVYVGTPAGTFTGPHELSRNRVLSPVVYPGNYRFWAINIPADVTFVQWQLIPPVNSDLLAEMYGGTNPVISFPVVGTYTVKMRWKGTCDDYGPYTEKNIVVIEDPYSTYSAAYPNPAGNELIIDREEKDSELKTNAVIGGQSAKAKNNATVKVLLYSHSTTQLVYSRDFSASEQQIRIDTSKLPNGIYYLNIIANGEKIKQQTIVVNH
jgi:hypothetical protein